MPRSCGRKPRNPCTLGTVSHSLYDRIRSDIPCDQDTQAVRLEAVSRVNGRRGRRLIAVDLFVVARQTIAQAIFRILEGLPMARSR